MNTQIIKNWRVDPDGLMRITASVLADGVYDYGLDEVDGAPAGVGHGGIVREFIPASGVSPECLASLEGKQLTVSTSDDDAHAWRRPESASSDGLAVGAVAGVPRVVDGAIVCDFLVTDADAIAAIKAGELAEVSAGYTANLDFTPGEFEGVPYDAAQVDFVFNHVLLLPRGMGRLGDKARILNKSTNMGGNMPEKLHSVKMTNKGGAVRTYRFTNAEDKDEAEKMAEEARADERGVSAVDVENAVARCNELKEELEVKNAEMEEAKAIIEDYKQQLSDLLDPEAQERMAQELLEQAEEEEAIMGDEAESAEVIELQNKMKNAKRSDRRRIIVNHVMARRGVSGADKWTDDAIAGAFAAMAVSAKAKRVTNASYGRIANGGVQAVKNSASSSQDALARMLAPWRKGVK